MKKWLLLAGMIGLVYGFTDCSRGAANAVNVPAQALEKLSDYHFFTGALAALQPNEGVLPYDLNSPLFSDYAHKARFVWMPAGSSAGYRTDQVLDLPEGTVLIKNFYYENDERDASQGRRMLETRLLIHRPAGWEAVGYIWNEEQTEAFLKVGGDIKAVQWVDASGQTQKVNYIIPNKNQCKNCHNHAGELVPIGPKVRNLNKAYNYPDGPMNQLDKWASLHYLSGYLPADTPPKVAVWDDADSGSLQERALAYLDVNCGHCHNPEGAANTSGLTLTADAQPGRSMGIFKPTVSAGAGTGGHTYSIVPGDPETSVMVYRMNSTEPGAMMPELGRRMVHQEGVALIRDWIREMDAPQTGDQEAATVSASK